MKKMIGLLLLSLLTGCRKNEVPAIGTFQAVVWAEKNLDCKIPEIEFTSPSNELERVMSTNQVRFNAIGLESRYVRQGQRLRVRVRKPFPNESVACTAFGPGYPLVRVLSAELD